MNLLAESLDWLADPQVWADGLLARTGQHLGLSLLVVFIAATLALPIGVWTGHTRRGGTLVTALAGSARALPTLGLLTLMGLLVGIGLTAPLIALVVLAVPSLLAAAHAGVSGIEATTVDAARAIGMDTRRVLTEVELPLASPVILGGVRTAVLQVISTTTLAAYTADIGLGRYLFLGLKTRDYPAMIGASLVVIALTACSELVFIALQRLARRRARV